MAYLIFVLNKRRNKYRYLFSIMVYIVSSIAIFDENKVIGVLIYWLATFITLEICYKEKCIDLVLISVWILFLLSLLDVMTAIIIRRADEILEVNNRFVAFFAALLTITFLFIIGRLVKKKNNRGIRTVKLSNLLFFTILTLLDTIMMTALGDRGIDGATKEIQRIYGVTYIFVVIGIFIQLGAVILLIVSRNLQKEKTEIVEKYLDEQWAYYEYLENREKETKKFRHDIKSHLALLCNLKDKDEYEEYLSEIIDKVEQLGNKISVGNSIVDAIVNQYYMLAEEQGIEMVVKGHFPNICKIRTFDLCTIFSNLLKNAFDAVQDIKQKKVWIMFCYIENEIIVEVGNYFEGEVKYSGNKIETLKENKDYHGWGMENVEESVMNNDGTIEIEIEDNKFIVTVILNAVKEGEWHENCGN